MGFWEVVILRKRVFHPEEPFLQKCNKIFLILCVVSLALDPFLFYVPVIDTDRKCLNLESNLETVVVALGSIVDILYIFRIIFQFRTGYSPISAPTFDPTILVDDSWKLARRYLLSYFVIDILATLPLTQVAVLLIIPRMGGSRILNTQKLLKYIVTIQLVPRFLRFYQLYKVTLKSSHGHAGVAQFTLFLYICAAHVIGAFWYLFSMEREMDCWQAACGNHAGCNSNELYCRPEADPNDQKFLDISCPVDLQGRSPFDFGVFVDAHNSGILESTSVLQKLLFCFLWALQNLSTLGQNLKTSTQTLEMFFVIGIFICGLVLFSFVIGIIQATMLSSTIRAEKMKMKRQDVEHWMDTHLLPPTLRKRIRQHQQYNWKKTKGLDVENLLLGLPKHLRRDIKRHLCWNLLLRVPLFQWFGEEVLEEVCESLKPVFYTEDICIVREGDPVDEMLFIMQGKLVTMTTDNGRTGFFNSGDFCGEGLLTWALDPRSSLSNLPISTRTVQTTTEVEAFVLMADDLKFVTSRQSRRLHSKRLRHKFRFYSQQWRTWAACFIQAAWRRYSKKKREESLRQIAHGLQDALARESVDLPSLGATIYASRFAVNALLGLRHAGTRKARFLEMVPSYTRLEKPAEPDFTAEEL